jgi:hypothetical protein
MKYNVKLFSFFMFFLFLFTAGGFAQEFSADIVSTAMGQNLSGKIYNAPGKARMETKDAITIARVDKNIAWVLMPGQKTYMEMPLTSSSVVAGGDKMPGEIERKLIGKETIDGKAVDKYYIVYTAGPKTEAIYSWILSDAGIPVKTVAENGSWQVEYKNINVGAQPDSLFEVPSDYSKFSLPSVQDMMQNAVKGALGK